mgnify:CR=1 FL=1
MAFRTSICHPRRWRQSSMTQLLTSGELLRPIQASISTTWLNWSLHFLQAAMKAIGKSYLIFWLGFPRMILLRTAPNMTIRNFERISPSNASSAFTSEPSIPPHDPPSVLACLAPHVWTFGQGDKPSVAFQQCRRRVNLCCFTQLVRPKLNYFAGNNFTFYKQWPQPLWDQFCWVHKSTELLLELHGLGFVASPLSFSLYG